MTDVLVARWRVWSLVWVVVSIPVTLLLTLPPTAPDAVYRRAIIRAEQLGRVLTVYGPVVANTASPYGLRDVATAIAPHAAAQASDNRYVAYLQGQALARERDAMTLHGARFSATLTVVILSACILPLWFALASLTRQGLRRRP